MSVALFIKLAKTYVIKFVSFKFQTFYKKCNVLMNFIDKYLKFLCLAYGYIQGYYTVNERSLYLCV